MTAKPHTSRTPAPEKRHESAHLRPDHLIDSQRQTAPEATAFAADDAHALRHLLAEVVRAAVHDMAHGERDAFNTALAYFASSQSPFEWHAAVLDLDVVAVRERLRAKLAARLGHEEAEKLWTAASRANGCAAGLGVGHAEDRAAGASGEAGEL